MDRIQKKYSVIITNSSDKFFIRIRIEAMTFHHLSVKIKETISIRGADFYFYNRNSREKFEALNVPQEQLDFVFKAAEENLK